jgi:hypothetical protein
LTVFKLRKRNFSVICGFAFLKRFSYCGIRAPGEAHKLPRQPANDQMLFSREPRSSADPTQAPRIKNRDSAPL